MILVLCLNAAVDKTALVRRFAAHALNRLERPLSLPGGKGLNVARALRLMGEKPLVLGFIAGHAGAFIEEASRREGLVARWIRLPKGESRVCLSILDGGPAPTEANEPGPDVSRRDLLRLEAEYRRLLPRARLVVLSGSLPLGCPPAAYARLIGLARRAGRPAFLDTSGAALASAVGARPELVKLNSEEASSLGVDPAKPAEALRSLLDRGPRMAAITVGPRGAVALFDGLPLRAAPPKVRVLTPIGAGDTFLAGLARSWLRGEPPERVLAYSVAAATASCQVLGAGLFRPRDAAALLRRVRVAPLS